MVAIGEHGSTSKEDPVHRAGQSRADGLHAAPQIARARRLDDQMHVVRLDRILDEPEAPALACPAEAGFDLPDADGHVAGMVRRENGATTMGVLNEDRDSAERAFP